MSVILSHQIPWDSKGGNDVILNKNGCHSEQ
jgi:hypothetical protein